MRNLKKLVRLIYTRPGATHERIAAEAGCHVHTVHRYRRLLLREGRERWHWGKLQDLDNAQLDRELNRRGDQGHRTRRSPAVVPLCGLSQRGSLMRAWHAYRQSTPNPCSYAHFVRQIRAQQAQASLTASPSPAPNEPDFSGADTDSEEGV